MNFLKGKLLLVLLDQFLPVALPRWNDSKRRGMWLFLQIMVALFCLHPFSLGWWGEFGPTPCQHSCCREDYTKRMCTRRCGDVYQSTLLSCCPVHLALHLFFCGRWLCCFHHSWQQHSTVEENILKRWWWLQFSNGHHTRALASVGNRFGERIGL